MGKTKELFMQYQEENDNLDWVEYIHYTECDLAQNECRLATEVKYEQFHSSNEMDSILQFFDKISEN
jgi:hypothetical protein